MLWRYIPSAWTGRLVRIKGNLDGPKYRYFLKKKILTELQVPDRAKPT